MPKNVVQYDLLISCPGDIINEISIIEDAVSQFNTQFSDALGISVRIKHWRKNSYAQSGGKPQKLLNEQFVNGCDAAVAILWTRFGTPTDEYGSGTEEEVEIMLSSGKQVFMYFSDKPLSPSQMNEDGYKKIQAFRDKYKDRGIYFTYSSDEEFKSLFFALGNLSQSTIPTNMFGSAPLTGTEEEKEKYHNIRELLETVSKALEWAPVENAFTDKKCLKLALQNCGTDIDEDIEISLKIPKNSLLPMSEFPKFNNDEMGYLLNDCDMSELFGICNTSTYSDYNSSVITSRRFSPRISTPSVFRDILPIIATILKVNLPMYSVILALMKGKIIL